MGVYIIIMMQGQGVKLESTHTGVCMEEHKGINVC